MLASLFLGYSQWPSPSVLRLFPNSRAQELNGLDRDTADVAGDELIEGGGIKGLTLGRSAQRRGVVGMVD